MSHPVRNRWVTILRVLLSFSIVSVGPPHLPAYMLPANTVIA